MRAKATLTPATNLEGVKAVHVVVRMGGTVLNSTLARSPGEASAIAAEWERAYSWGSQIESQETELAA